MLQMREIKAASVGVAVVAAYLLLVLASGRVDAVDLGRMLSRYLVASFALWIFVGFVLNSVRLGIAAIRSGSEPFLPEFLRRVLRARWERDRCVSLLWPPLLFALLMASFNAYKQMVLPLAGFRFDPLFAAMDRALFFGQDPWRVSHALFPSDELTLMIDSAYHGWFVPMAVGLAVCAYLPASSYRLRTQYMLTYIGVWIGIGSILAFLLPAAGPCFYSHFVEPHQSFDHLRQRLLEAQAGVGTPLAALKNQAMLLKAFGSSSLETGAGISAMPSVHNGLAVLFALGALRLNRIVGCIFAAYAILIWIGSFHLGWHYAIDGLVAAVLTVALWKVSGRIADALDRPQETAAPQAAIA
jgi:hypothetical protein